MSSYICIFYPFNCSVFKLVLDSGSHFITYVAGLKDGFFSPIQVLTRPDTA